MPEICRFYGIIIYMFSNEHNPPHFHFSYGDYEGLMYINDGVIEGKAPAKVVNKIDEWRKLHLNELLKIWNQAVKGEPLPKVEPLK